MNSGKPDRHHMTKFVSHERKQFPSLRTFSDTHYQYLNTSIGSTS